MTRKTVLSYARAANFQLDKAISAATRSSEVRDAELLMLVKQRRILDRLVHRLKGKK